MVELGFDNGYEEVLSLGDVFVSAGNVHGNPERTYYNHIRTTVRKGDTLPKVGKELRKDLAKLWGVKPASLWWAVYTGVDSRIPIRSSNNYPGQTWTDNAYA